MDPITLSLPLKTECALRVGGPFVQRTFLGQVLPLQAPGWVRAHLLSPGPTLSLCWSPLYFTQLHHQTASPAPPPGPCGPCESRQLHLGPGPTGPERKRQSPLPISRAGAERGERRCSAAEQADARGKTHQGPVPSTSLSVILFPLRQESGHQQGGHHLDSR